jgi:hypothetical protein
VTDVAHAGVKPVQVKPTEPTPNPSLAAVYFARQYIRTGKHEFNVSDRCDPSDRFVNFIMEERCEVVEMKGLWLRVSAEDCVVTVEDITPGSITHPIPVKPKGPFGPLRAQAKLPLA